MILSILSQGFAFVTSWTRPTSPELMMTLEFPSRGANLDVPAALAKNRTIPCIPEPA